MLISQSTYDIAILYYVFVYQPDRLEALKNALININLVMPQEWHLN